ncbi:MAG: hypothetical protein O9338_15415, partial [Microcystis sp. LE19-251.1A]|nr:hypothetical protein [Cytophagales bacterium]MCZ8364098.1 hypothetical protein [Microcystis sp. LE19-251.1A]
LKPIIVPPPMPEAKSGPGCFGVPSSLAEVFTAQQVSFKLLFFSRVDYWSMKNVSLVLSH